MEINKEIKNTPAANIPFRRYLPVISLFLIGIIFSLIVFWFIRSWEKKNQHVEFESWAKAYSNSLESTLNEYLGAVQFLGDFYNNSNRVSRQEFDNLTNSMLLRYPGIQAFGWDPLVKKNERAKYESLAREAGFNDFEFTERNKNNELVRAAVRDEYVVVYFIQPLESNMPAFGFDIASNSTRLKAITNAFNTGKLAATDRITLVQETGNQFGVLLLLPVYNQGVPLKTLQERVNNRKGFVVEVLRIGTAIETALQGYSDEGINLSVYDMSASDENRFLYQWTSQISESVDQPILEEEIQSELIWSKTIDFAEREWKIICSPSDYFYQSRILWQGWTVLIGSMLLIILSAFYMLRKIRHAAEIEQRILVQEHTNKQLKIEINERSLAEIERDKTIKNLKHALEEVKTLRGILPICSYCKKVRDDEGYWEQVEVYIHKHSLADFSHSVCPDCVKKHYPDFLEDNPPDKE